MRQHDWAKRDWREIALSFIAILLWTTITVGLLHFAPSVEQGIIAWKG